MAPRGSRWSYASLALIVLIGLALRITGIGWSLPDSRHPFATYHPDELVNLGASQQADLIHGKFDIGFYNYGAFYFYLVNVADTIGHGYGLIPTSAIVQAKGISEEELQAVQVRERAGDFLAGRLVTALMGVATIPVVFALGCRLYNRRTGLLGALLYALAPLPALHAHFLTVDVPATLFVSLALLSAARLLTGGGWREIVLAGVWCGLATATKYTAGVCLVAPLCAVALVAARNLRGEQSTERVHTAEHSPQQTAREVTDSGGAERNTAGANKNTAAVERLRVLRTACAKLGVLLGLTAVVFLVACPGPWLNWHAFWEGTYDGSGLRFELFQHAREGHGHLFEDTGPGWLYHLRVSLPYGLGLPLLLLSLAGCAYAARRHKPADLVLLVFVVLTYLATTFSAVRFARYLIPLTPALCLLAARVVAERYSRRMLRRVVVACGFLVVVATGVVSGSLSRAMILRDPRDTAADYLTAQAAPHAIIGFAHVPWFYSPPLSPLWGALRADVREQAPPALPIFELRIGEWDQRVLTPLPDFLVLSNLELGTEWKRLRLPPAVAFMDAIPANAAHTVFKPGPIPGLSPDDPNAPQDLLYVLPEITVYRFHHPLR